MAKTKKNDENTQQCFTAIAQKNLDAARRLFEAGANPNAVDRDGKPMLFYALWSPVEFGQLVLEFGGDVDVRNNWGQTALHYAASSASLDYVDFLLAQGADPHALTNNNATLLHSAASAREGGRQLCELFLKLGVKADVWTKNQYLPVHFAASSGTVDTCRFFSELGYSSSLVPDDARPEYKTPFQCAVEGAKIDKVQYYMDECGESLDQLTLDGRSMPKLVHKVYKDMHGFLKSAVTTKAIDRSFDELGAPPPVARRASPSPM